MVPFVICESLCLPDLCWALCNANMLFNSPIFLFCFAPLFFTLYFLTGKSLRNILIILSSLCLGGPTFVGIIIISDLFDWFVGNAIFHENRKATRQLHVTVGILANVGLM
jgi:alginate O-acetyltransferase complex protein AlgI